jgi:uncharacterized glyoxalase superfamily protein PhnB
MPLIPARIDAVTLAVQDIARSAAFYREVMGFAQVADSEAVKGFDLGTVRLDLIDKKVLLEETYLADLPVPPGPVTLVLSVTRAEVDEYMKNLEDAGVNVIAPAEDKRLGPHIGYVSDPDGHMWEIGAFDG